jgi:hypothetical protein
MTTTHQGGCVHQHYLTNPHHTSIDMCVAFVRLSTCMATMQDSITTKIAGTGRGNPRVHLCGPLRKPVPAERVRVFGGYGSGYIQKYPGVTCAFH